MPALRNNGPLLLGLVSGVLAGAVAGVLLRSRMALGTPQVIRDKRGRYRDRRGRYVAHPRRWNRGRGRPPATGL